MSIIDDIMGNPIAPGPSPLTPPFPPMQSAQNPPLPGVGTGGTPPFVGNPAQDQAQGMNQAVAQMIMQRQMAGQGGGQAPMPGTPGRVGAMLPGAPLPFMGQGPQIPGTPNATALAQMGPRGQIPQQNVNSPVEFRTKAGRNAQIVKDAINNFGTAVNQIKQEQWNKKASQTSQAWSEQVDAQQVLATSQDPQARKLAQAKLDAMQKDPKLQKAFAKAHEDPTSAEGVGVQRAMQMRQAQAAQQVEMEAKQAQMQYQLAEAAKARASIPQNAQERGVAMGTEPSADAKLQYETQKMVRQNEMEFKRDQLKQQGEIARDRLTEKTANDQDRAAAYRESIAARLQIAEMNAEIKKQQLEGKSKMPATLQDRVFQAQQIDQLSNQLLEGLKDPEIRKEIGLYRGQAAFFTRRVNDKFADWMTTYGSLVAMQPRVHGYRGGVQVDKLFQGVLVGPGQKPEALEAALKGLRQLPKNIIYDMRRAYPKDPLFSDPDISGIGDPKANEMFGEQQAAPAPAAPQGAPGSSHDNPIVIPSN